MNRVLVDEPPPADEQEAGSLFGADPVEMITLQRKKWIWDRLPGKLERQLHNDGQKHAERKTQILNAQANHRKQIARHIT